jgi:hypothetical protein
MKALLIAAVLQVSGLMVSNAVAANVHASVKSKGAPLFTPVK